MPVFNLHPEFPVFPHPSLASNEGLLAIGGNLSPQWLYTAYSFGIFPWFDEGQPILWWYTAPRSVLYPAKLRISKTLRSTMRKGVFRVTFNEDFGSVIRYCAGIDRPGQDGTWILSEMIEAYSVLHDIGLAHSVEVWNSEGRLVGGLYGILLGKVFFGESMFAKESNASKVGFAVFVSHLREQGIRLIDCQQDTEHMRTLGAETIPGEEFLEILRVNQLEILANPSHRIPDKYSFL